MTVRGRYLNPNSCALCNTCQNRIPLLRLLIPPHLLVVGLFILSPTIRAYFLGNNRHPFLRQKSITERAPKNTTQVSIQPRAQDTKLKGTRLGVYMVAQYRPWLQRLKSNQRKRGYESRLGTNTLSAILRRLSSPLTF